MEPVAFLFAGQGSQYVGMGKTLYETFAESKAIFDQADRVLGFGLSQLCFAGPQAELTQSQNCQPAVLTLSIAALETFRQVVSGKRQVVSYTAGLSLGEYSALVAAEVLSFEDAVYLVRRRGEFMEEAALKFPGKMACVLGLDQPIIENICKAANTEIANINCPGQIVISGGIKEIKQAERLAQDYGAKRVIPLEVSGAFHSSLMKEAALKLAQELDKIEFNIPQIAVISNVTAQPVTCPEEIKHNLIEQVSSCVRWEDSLRFILSKGIKKFFEFGPGEVLKGLMHRIEPEAEVVSIETKDLASPRR